METDIHLIVSPSVLRRMRNVSGKIVDNNKTYFMFNNLFLSETRAVFEIIGKNALEPVRPQMTTRRIRIACWIIKATSTHSEYVILIAFPLHQCLHESASALCYTYTACLVYLKIPFCIPCLYTVQQYINKHLPLTLFLLTPFNFHTPSSNHAGLPLSYLADILHTVFYPK